MLNSTTLPVYVMFLPILTAVLSVVARNPIHAILWLTRTFLLTCGLLFHQFKLGFSASLIIIVYVGAIAILFLFIVMLIPVKERSQLGLTLKRVGGQFIAVLFVYLGCGYLLTKHVIDSAISQNSEFWARFANLLDHQKLYQNLPTNEQAGPSLTDLYLDDISIYGVKLYQDYAFPIMLVGLVLLFILVAAIMLCKEE